MAYSYHMNKQQERFHELIREIGGVKRLADMLECEPAAIYQWGGEIPKARTYEIESLTHGKYTHQYLRPDLFKTR